MVFEIDSTALSPRQAADPSLRSTVIRQLHSRAMRLSREPTVQAQGAMIVATLPGFTDVEKAAATLSVRHEFFFYDARTVTTGDGRPRLVDIGEQTNYKGLPAYAFVKRDGTEIKPGTPEYATLIKDWRSPILDFGDLEEVDLQPRGESYIPVLKFTAIGSQKIEKWSRMYTNAQRQLACVIDGIVVSIAPLRQGTVLKDNAVIDGTFDKDYVLQLREAMNAERLSVDLLVRGKRKY